MSKFTHKIAAAMILGGALMAANAASQELVKAGSLGGFKGDAKIFTGEVQVTSLFNKNAFQSFSGGLVEFSPGARSAWHTHPVGQTLIVVDGAIVSGDESGAVSLAQKGDVIVCPPDVRHWHGATDKVKGAHIALTGYKGDSNVVWLEKVSDKEYKAALNKAK